MEEPSAAVRAFIDAYIESIDFLRVLLLLAREGERTWTVDDISHAAALPRDAAQLQLQRVTAAGLAAASEAPATYRYSPRANEFHEMVKELIELDDTRPVTLIRLVYGRKSSSAQAFADAFRLRRN